ncbi:unnamed protein product [Rhizophagus irregularis]|nr:unnamed protein product [Rhizophagus irregularis]
MSSTSLGFLHETNSEAIYTSRLLSFDNLPKAKNSEAIYTSRLLSFDNLPKAKNSDDYYKYKDNIISVEFSASLSQQIDVSRLDINDSNLPEPKHSDYEQNNDIISMEYSETLQIDISQLNINEDGEL